MSTSANKLVYDVAWKLNSIRTGRANDFLVVDMVSAINTAYQRIMSLLIAQKDKSETIRNHLRPLLKQVALNCVPTDDPDVCRITYPDDFYEVNTIRVTATKDCCEGEKKFPVQKPQGDDVDEARENPYRRADYYFEHLPCYEWERGLEFYHDQLLDVEEVNLKYYRRVKRIEAPEMVDCVDNVYRNWDDEVISDNVDFEISTTYLDDTVTDVATYLLENAAEDYAKANEKIKEIIQINQLYK